MIAGQSIDENASVSDEVLVQSARWMRDSRTELRGTIASIFQEADVADENGMIVNLLLHIQISVSHGK